RRDGENLVGAQVQRRRERCGEPDAAVAMPRVLDADRGKEERQGGGAHHVIDREARRDAAAFRTFPLLDVAPLHPDDRLSGAVVGRTERDRAQCPAREVLIDAAEDTVAWYERTLQKRAQWVRVDEAARLRLRDRSSGDESHAPSNQVG